MNGPIESDPRPPDTVLKAFGLARHELLPLSGGTDRAWRAEHVVLKPCYDPVEWRWMATHLRGVRQDGFRLMPTPFDHPTLRQMFDLRQPIHLESQLVHGDLGGNVLFAEDLPPAVIDISPYWRPVGFAAAVVVADAVCWEGAASDPFYEAISTIEQFPQLLVRALIFRIVTSLVFYGAELDLSGYAPGIEMALSLIR